MTQTTNIVEQGGLDHLLVTSVCGGGTGPISTCTHITHVYTIVRMYITVPLQLLIGAPLKICLKFSCT